jgi:group II intron reverse transcriptase/maturase
MNEQLMEEMVQEENMRGALKEVVKNGGAPGIDHMRVEELAEHLPRHWEAIKKKLLAGTYVPSPVKRVEIAKRGGGVRMLGIPTVLDRCIQQMMLRVLQPIYEAKFSEHSYGFRPGRSAHDAVRAAQEQARGGRKYVVDIDITKFFDHVNHDILMTEIRETVGDKRVKRLIGKYLRAGVLIEGVKVRVEEGTPQGGPLTPFTQSQTLNSRIS